MVHIGHVVLNAAQHHNMSAQTAIADSCSAKQLCQGELTCRLTASMVAYLICSLIAYSASFV